MLMHADSADISQTCLAIAITDEIAAVSYCFALLLATSMELFPCKEVLLARSICSARVRVPRLQNRTR